MLRYKKKAIYTIHNTYLYIFQNTDAGRALEFCFYALRLPIIMLNRMASRHQLIFPHVHYTQVKILNVSNSANANFKFKTLIPSHCIHHKRKCNLFCTRKILRSKGIYPREIKELLYNVYICIENDEVLQTIYQRDFIYPYAYTYIYTQTTLNAKKEV